MKPQQHFILTVPVNDADHAMGAEQAPVTLVEYGDFECPNCKQAAPAIKILLEHFAGRVRFVYRHFPLEEVHPHAMQAAEAAEAAAAQGRFWPMHDLLFDRQLHLASSQLCTCAQELRLDMTRFAAALDGHLHLQRVREHRQSGSASGVHGTPAFFVNGVIADASFTLHELYDAVEAALRRP